MWLRVLYDMTVRGEEVLHPDVSFPTSKVLKKHTNTRFICDMCIVPFSQKTKQNTRESLFIKVLTLNQLPACYVTTNTSCQIYLQPPDKLYLT